MGVDRRPQIDQEVVDDISSLGHARRLEILLTLGDVERKHHQQRYTLSFTELFTAVDIDSSSQFSYHLKQLVGPFVNETPDGYCLTYGGSKIVRVIRSGLYETTSTFEATEVSGACLFCDDGTPLATLDDERFRIRCTACDAILVTVFFPQSQTRGRTPTEIVESFGYRIWSMYVQLRGGVCPECFGPVETVVDRYEYGDTALHIHNSTCRECRFLISMPIAVPVVFHPAVSHLFWEHGISVLDVPLWKVYEYITADVIETEIVSDEPFSATVTVTLDDETLSLAMDDSASVSLVSTEQE